MEALLDHSLLLAVAIFLARVADVSMGTLRTILVFRRHVYLAACLGFIETAIWVLAAGSVLQDLGRWYLVVAYAGGFAAGNVVGARLEARLALGTELVRAISADRTLDLASTLRQRGYDVTALEGRNGRDAPVEVLYVVEKRRRVSQLLKDILELDPDAICSIADVRPHQAVPAGRWAWRSRPGIPKRK